MTQSVFFSALAVVLLPTTLALAAPPLPPGDRQPLLRLEAGGPTAFVTSLAFSPDGKTLYAAGFDKVVRVWTLNPRTDRFDLDRTSYRVPIGPGLDGAINALALSSDGRWLAAAGKGMFRGAALFREDGQWLPVSELSDEMWLDQGLIYLFNTQTGQVRLLRGHRGPVLSLAFAPEQHGLAPVLASAARERAEKKDDYRGVIRLWDVDQATELARQAPLPDPKASRPGLVVLRSGKEAKELHVGLAWGDGHFRLWDVAAAKLWEEDDGTFNTSIAFLPETSAIATGSWKDATGTSAGYGQVSLWTVPPGKTLQATSRLKFPTVDGAHFYPWELAACSAPGNGKRNRLAVALRAVTRDGDRIKEDDRLRLVNPDPKEFRGDAEAIPLWKKGGHTVLATAPQGSSLAVAGNADHTIAVFRLGDLVDGQAKPRLLASEGLTLRRVSFTSRDKDLGLILGPGEKRVPGLPVRDAQAGDLLFDFTQRRLTTDTRGWKVAAPDLTGWSVTLEPEEKNKSPVALVTRQGEKKVGRTELKSGEKITDYALLPPGRFEVPLLAVAYLDRFRLPALAIYNARTGEAVRLLTGHQGVIHDVAFSPDGRLLASASDDQTIAVWSLLGFEQALGGRGQFPGVLVEQSGGTLSMRVVDPTSPAAGKIERGAVLQGLVRGDKLQNLATPRAFYDAVFLTKPGERLTLRLRDPQGKEQDLTLTVQQGVDERKPLFSLFVTRAQPGAAPEWVAWTSVGPYDASDRKVERLIGWHVNTGKAEEPTTFALADQYRKEFFRSGLLKHLVVRGGVSDALNDWKKEARRNQPPPVLTLLLEAEEEAHKVQGVPLLQQPQARLRLSVDALDESEEIAAAEWNSDGGAVQAMAAGAANEFSATLSSRDWKRGPHTVNAIVRLKDGPAYRKELMIHYQPPPPVVTLTAPPQRTVNAAEFVVKGEVRPGPGEQPVRVRLLHKQGAKERVVTQWESDQPRALSEKVDLPSGENVFELVAVNKGALAGHEEVETARRSMLLVFAPRQAPSVSLDELVPLARGSAAQKVVPGHAAVVHVPQVRILGVIKAEEKLAQATWSRDEKAGRPLSGFVANKSTEVAIAEEVDLEPGLQRIRFRMQTAGGVEAESVLAIEYRPLLPEVVLTRPVDGSVFHEGRDPAAVRVEAELLPVVDRQPFKILVRVNGKEAAQATLDEKKQKLSALVALQPGSNRIEVRLSNDWKETAGAATTVAWRRCPTVLSLSTAEAAERPVVDVEGEVTSPVELPLTAAEVQVDLAGAGGSRSIPAELKKDREQDQTVRWKVLARNVPLEVGTNTLRLLASNPDGICLEPARKQVVIKARTVARPRVELLDPRENKLVDEPRFTLSFRVQSTGNLRKVEVWQDDKVIYTPRPAALTKTPAGAVEIKESVPVELGPGANRFRVVAVNDGGEADAAALLSYLAQPVTLLVDRLESKERPGEFLPAEKGAHGRLVFPSAAPEGRLWLHGRAVWKDRTDPKLEDRTAEVRIWVNGFRQTTAQLMPRSGDRLERSFRAEILLGRQTGNHVDIELPDLKQKVGNQPEFDLDCLKPEDKQRLHLLIVAVGEKDRQAVKTQVLKALQAEPISDREFRTPAFPSGYLYGPLLENVSRNSLITQLREMQLRIEARSQRSPSSDVVLIYYKGGESFAVDPFLWSSIQADQRQPALTHSTLASWFQNTPGAHVVLLDVARDGSEVQRAPQTPRLAADARFGVFRLAWMGLEGARQTELMTSLGEAMTRGSTLKEVAALLDERLAPLTRQSPQAASFDHFVPSPLAELVLSRSR